MKLTIVLLIVLLCVVICESHRRRGRCKKPPPKRNVPKCPRGMTCKCKPGWTRILYGKGSRRSYGKTCYRVFNNHVSWERANGICDSHGAKLFKADKNLDDDIYGYLSTTYAGAVSNNFWIGCRCKRRRHDCRWSKSKGTIARGYAPWDFDDDKDDDDSKQCVSWQWKLKNRRLKIKWKRYGCVYQRKPFMCQMPVVQCKRKSDFICDDYRKCLKKSKVCDSKRNCFDGSDEKNCAQCGGNFIGQETGTLQSPNYPKHYSKYLDCVWTITVGEKSKVVLQIDEFDIQSAYWRRGKYRERDYVKVENCDGYPCPRILYGYYKPSGKAFTLTSVKNTITVRFHSDGSGERRGFKFSWTTFTSPSCGGEHFSTSVPKYISSPGFPAVYNGETECSWLLTGLDEAIITLQFTAFDLALGDYVTVYDGRDVNAKVIGRFGGNELPDVVMSTFKYMLVQFVTDDRRVSKGFQALHWQGCDVTIGKKCGVIQSPGKPHGQNYPASLSCSWNISLSQPMSLTFKSFHTEVNNDKVMVSDSSLKGSTSTNTVHSGKQTFLLPLRSVEGVYVLFSSDSSVQQSGWSASYSVDCPPHQLRNNVKVSSVTTLVGDRVQFSCANGYEMEAGERSWSVCQPCGQWSRPPPTCYRVTCDKPDKIKHGYRLTFGNEFYYGDEVGYKCYYGYRLVGGNIKCTTNGWTGSTPVCKVLECDEPQQVTNGKVSYPNLNVGSRMTSTCDKGFYALSGDSAARCLPNGKWSNEDSPLQCTAVTCVHPWIRNADYELGLFPYGYTLQISCKTGFKLHDDDLRLDRLKCEDTDRWGDRLPRCIDINECVKNTNVCGEKHYCVNMFGSYRCKCADHYQPSQDEKSCLDINECRDRLHDCARTDLCVNTDGGFICKCQEGQYEVTTEVNGENITDCLWNECRNIDCEGCTLTFRDDKQLPNTTALINCNPGYHNEGPRTLTCLLDGTWSNKKPRCERVICDELDLGLFSEVMNVTYSTNDRGYGSTAAFSCVPGFVLRGVSQLRCERTGYDNGVPIYDWSGNIPYCRGVECPDLQEIAHGSVLIKQRLYRYVAIHSCDEGYELLGERRHRCLMNGTWSGSPPTCQSTGCPALKAPKYGDIMIGEERFREGALVNFVCDAGFEISDPSPLQCAKEQPPTTPPPTVTLEAVFEISFNTVDIDAVPASCLSGYYTTIMTSRFAVTRGLIESIVLLPLCGDLSYQFSYVFSKRVDLVVLKLAISTEQNDEFKECISAFEEKAIDTLLPYIKNSLIGATQLSFPPGDNCPRISAFDAQFFVITGEAGVKDKETSATTTAYVTTTQMPLTTPETSYDMVVISQTKPGVSDLSEGEVLQIACYTVLPNAQTLIMKKNNQPVGRQSSGTIRSSLTFTIASTTARDSGNYTCEANTTGGTFISKTLEINVFDDEPSNGYRLIISLSFEGSYTPDQKACALNQLPVVLNNLAVVIPSCIGFEVKHYEREESVLFSISGSNKDCPNDVLVQLETYVTTTLSTAMNIQCSSQISIAYTVISQCDKDVLSPTCVQGWNYDKVRDRCRYGSCTQNRLLQAFDTCLYNPLGIRFEPQCISRTCRYAQHVDTMNAIGNFSYNTEHFCCVISNSESCMKGQFPCPSYGSMLPNMAILFSSVCKDVPKEDCTDVMETCGLKALDDPSFSFISETCNMGGMANIIGCLKKCNSSEDVYSKVSAFNQRYCVGSRNCHLQSVFSTCNSEVQLVDHENGAPFLTYLFNNNSTVEPTFKLQICGNEQAHSTLRECTMDFLQNCTAESYPLEHQFKLNAFNMINAICDYQSKRISGSNTTGGCENICTAQYDPVCASDGNTYGNLCEMKRAACKSNRTLTVVSKAECGGCETFCTAQYDPVCASDGNTYGNLCEMKRAACKSNRTLTVVSKAECGGCETFCTEQYDPVCASDRNTYGNLCKMNVAACTSNRTLTVVSKGECGTVKIKPSQAMLTLAHGDPLTIECSEGAMLMKDYQLLSGKKYCVLSVNESHAGLYSCSDNTTMKSIEVKIKRDVEFFARAITLRAFELNGQPLDQRCWKGSYRPLVDSYLKAFEGILMSEKEVGHCALNKPSIRTISTQYSADGLSMEIEMRLIFSNASCLDDIAKYISGLQQKFPGLSQPNCSSVLVTFAAGVEVLTHCPDGTLPTQGGKCRYLSCNVDTIGDNVLDQCVHKRESLTPACVGDGPKSCGNDHATFGDYSSGNLTNVCRQAANIKSCAIARTFNCPQAAKDEIKRHVESYVSVESVCEDDGNVCLHPREKCGSVFDNLDNPSYSMIHKLCGVGFGKMLSCVHASTGGCTGDERSQYFTKLHEFEQKYCVADQQCSIRSALCCFSELADAQGPLLDYLESGNSSLLNSFYLHKEYCTADAVIKLFNCSASYLTGCSYNGTETVNDIRLALQTACATEQRPPARNRRSVLVIPRPPISPPVVLPSNDTSSNSTPPKWNATGPFCRDIEPPRFINCPGGKIIISERKDGSAINYRIPRIRVRDNSGAFNVTYEPNDLRPGEFILLTQTTTFSVHAVDEAGNKATCDIVLQVTDITPPRIECPTKVQVVNIDTISPTASLYHSPISVYDYHGIANITYTPANGSQVYVLDTKEVTVTAFDNNGLSSSCTYDVELRPLNCQLDWLETPKNGTKKCTRVEEGQNGSSYSCHVTCPTFYAFYEKAPTFVCSLTDGDWYPHNNVPDCGALVLPQYFVHVRTHFAPCGGDWKESNYSSTLSSLVTNSIQSLCGDIGITYDVTSRTTSLNGTVVAMEANIIMTTSQSKTDFFPYFFKESCLDTTLKAALEQSQDLCSDGSQTSPTVDDDGYSCEPGYGLFVDEYDETWCMKCQAGLYSLNNKCVECERSSFQPDEGQGSCITCPNGTTTLLSGSKHQRSCKRMCRPGRYSSSGVAPCSRCPVGSFSGSNMATNCTSCPIGSSTVRDARRNINNCYDICPPGTYSPTGLAVGSAGCTPCDDISYQDEPQSTSCKSCPTDLGTGFEGSKNGSDCVSLDPCSDNPCNSQTCMKLSMNAYLCECDPGYTGTECESIIDNCIGQNCNRHGTCVNAIGSYSCNCSAGFEGQDCEDETNECKANPCLYGTCDDLHLDYICNCDYGYNGKNCDNEIDNCDPNPCVEANGCQSFLGGYICDCKPGFEGKNCSENIDECQTNNNPCENGATCNDLVNGYNCTCVPGFRGFNCSEEIDECKEPAGNPCENGGVCTDEVNSFWCTCQPGYEGEKCEIDKNECDPDPCENGNCTDQVNGYNCSCLAGFDGINCARNIDDCAENACHPNNTLQCNDGINEYTCNCRPGYTGDLCENNIDDCDPNLCENNSTCHDLLEDFRCECDDTKNFEGKYCNETIDNCISSQCKNNGTCINGVRTYTCGCLAGFTDEDCGTNIDDCGEPDPCQNNGTCTDKVNGFECSCPPGFTGTLCDEDIDECNSTTPVCLNDAICHNLPGDYKCECKAGFYDDACESATNECEPYPCMNGGNCTDLHLDYNCTCPLGYEGKNCSVNIDDCLQNDCENNGTCQDGIASYTCVCPKKYSGDYCDLSRTDDFDIFFDGSDTAQCQLELLSPVCDFTLLLWVRSTKKGYFLSLYDDSSNSYLLYMSTKFIEDKFSTRTKPHGVDFGDSRWHHVAITYNGTALSYSIDGSFIHASYGQQCQRSLSILLGQRLQRANNKFLGEINGVNMYSHIMDADTIMSLGTNCTIKAPEADVVMWLEFDEETLEGGASRVEPSKICDGKCQDGYEGPNCDIEIDDTPPVIQCPEDVSYVNNSVGVPLIFEKPTFSDNVGVSSVKCSMERGQIVSPGEYDIDCQACDAAENCAECSFKVNIQAEVCIEPEPPVNGQLAFEKFPSGAYAVGSCFRGYKPVEAISPYYSCQGGGSWNFLQYHDFDNFPACASFYPAKMQLKINARGNGPCNVEKLKEKFLETLRASNKYNFCPGCDFSKCSVKCAEAKVDANSRRRRAAGDVVNDIEFSFDVPTNGSNVTSTQDMLDDMKNEVKNYKVDNLTLDSISGGVAGTCDDGQVLDSDGTSCVACPPGTKFDRNETSNATSCITCPVGFYNELESQTECLQCPDGKITIAEGTLNASKCFRNCEAGSYYSQAQDACVDCERGKYQDLAGEWFCISCEEGQTTLAEGATSLNNCTDCPLGKELTANMECVGCEKGYYRGENESACTPCELGYTTPGQQEDSEEDCNVPIICSAITLTGGNVSPPPNLNGGYSHSSAVQFTCNGSKLIGNSSSFCQAGEWTKVPPTCERYECEAITESKQVTKVTLSDVNYAGSIASYQVNCSSNQILKGSTSRRCVLSNDVQLPDNSYVWEGEQPECEDFTPTTEATTQATEATTQANEATSQATEATTQATEATTQAKEVTSQATEATTQATEATTQAKEVTSQATEASTQATEATTQAKEVTTQATEATTQATEATTQANEATTQATEATTQAKAATSQATEATTQATEATTQAKEVTSQATEATTQATEATTQAKEATTQATEATTQAKEATSQATEATTQATEATTQAKEVTSQATEATTRAAQATTQATEETTKAADPTTKAADPTTEQVPAGPADSKFTCKLKLKNKVFTDSLKDKNSNDFKKLAATLKKLLNLIFASKYRGVVIIAFGRGSVTAEYVVLTKQGETATPTEVASTFNSGLNTTNGVTRLGDLELDPTYSSFQSAGTNVPDIDYCAEEMDDCHMFANCVSTGAKQYTCVCRGGYSGDGKTCEGKEDTSLVGIIAAACVAGILAIGVIIALVVCKVKRTQSRSKQDSQDRSLQRSQFDQPYDTYGFYEHMDPTRPPPQMTYQSLKKTPYYNRYMNENRTSRF